MATGRYVVGSIRFHRMLGHSPVSMRGGCGRKIASNVKMTSASAITPKNSAVFPVQAIHAKADSTVFPLNGTKLVRQRAAQIKCALKKASWHAFFPPDSVRRQSSLRQRALLMPQKIFISYRREDTAANALGIGQYLEKEFGRKSVFIDVDMRAGAKFPAVLEQRLAQCKVMLVLIGPDWLDARDDQGHRRLESPDDWVHLEIAHALKRDIAVIPVRVNGAELPARAALPEDIRGLLDHQAVSVTHTGFRHEMSGLVRDIRSIPGPRAGRPLRVRVAAVAAGLLLALAALVVAQTSGRLKLFDGIHAFTFLESTTTTNPTGIWSNSPGEWVLYAYDQDWVGYYFKRGSVKTFGDDVTYIARFPFKTLEAGEQSERPLSAYQDDRIVFDCKKSVYAPAETTIYNRAGEIISHFKRAEPEAMDMSTGGAIPSGSILSLAQYIMCNEQIRTPLAEQIKRAKLTYLSGTNEADLYYDSPRKVSASAEQFEVLIVAKYFRVHSFSDFANGHPIIGVPGSVSVQAQTAKVSCADRTVLKPSLSVMTRKIICST
jgi:TIR domain